MNDRSVGEKTGFTTFHHCVDESLNGLRFWLNGTTVGVGDRLEGFIDPGDPDHRYALDYNNPFGNRLLRMPVGIYVGTLTALDEKNGRLVIGLDMCHNHPIKNLDSPIEYTPTAELAANTLRRKNYEEPFPFLG